jgi:mannosyltransferase OCH1-like enzyme
MLEFSGKIFSRKYPKLMIPKILHQTWKDANLPPYMAALQQTWREHHPDWEYRLWTDLDNHNFLKTYYPWFLPIYEGYEHFICRVDAIRYFWLYHYGGVYVDLDFECLSPLDDLLIDRSLLIGLEPAAHQSANLTAKAENLSMILSPALIASVAGDHFWQHVWAQLAISKNEQDPLAATGPFFLTKAYQSYPDRSNITLIPAAQLHPVTLEDVDRGKLFSLIDRNQIATQAVAIHHWLGSWWQPLGDDLSSDRSDCSVLVFEQGHQITESKFKHLNYQSLVSKQDRSPRVSCLMVTKNRAKLAKRAIFCFLQQTYQNKELVIIDDGDSDDLAKFIARFPHPQIQYYRLQSQSLTLGGLRNLSVANSTGDYVCQWDDDDLSDPVRVELQMSIIQAFKVDACFLDNLYHWFPHQQRLARSCLRVWEGTLLSRKDILTAYPDLQKGEDTVILKSLIENYRLAALNDRPELYIYGIHENNTWDTAHFDAHWQASQVQYENDEYINLLQKLAHRVPIHPYLQSLQTPAQSNGINIIDYNQKDC